MDEYVPLLRRKAAFDLAKRLTDESEGKLIKEIRSSIPFVPCIEGCTACCEKVGITGRHFFSRWEWAQIKDKREFPESGRCPYLSESGCDIYEDRPLICRLYGSVARGPMRCVNYQVPDKPLSEQEYAAIDWMRNVFLLRTRSRNERRIAYKQIMNALGEKP